MYNGNPLVMNQVLLHPSKVTTDKLDQFSKAKILIYKASLNQFFFFVRVSEFLFYFFCKVLNSNEVMKVLLHPSKGTTNILLLFG